MKLNECIKNSFTLSFDSWTTDREVVNLGLEYQLVVGSFVKVTRPKCIIATHQTEARSGTENKTTILSVIDHLHVGKYFVEIDGLNYPKDSININYARKDYFDHYSDPNLFFEEYANEPLLKLFITYTGVKEFYLIVVLGPRLKVDLINPIKIQLFEVYRGNADNTHNNARSFPTLFRRRVLRMVLDDNKITTVGLIQMTILSFKDFMEEQLKRWYYDRK